MRRTEVGSAMQGTAGAGPRRTPVLHHLPRIADRFLLQSLRLRGYASRRLHTSVGSLHVLDARGGGELPPVVILHGLSASGQYYENLMRRVRPHVSRVVAPDMPGHGYSELPAEGLNQDTLGIGLREGLDQVLGRPAVVFGNSLGAAAAVRYAAERPERVLGLVLAAPGGAPMESKELEEFVDGFMLHDHGKALEFVDRLFHRPHPMRHLIAWGVRQQFGRTGIEDLLRSIRPEDLLHADELEGLRMPVLVLWGEADRVLRPEHRRFFEEHLPTHAEVHRLAEYGHVPHMSHPSCLSERLLEFTRRVADA
ncbi:MAG TPA: alpha/beta hydrolase [Sandaracinaceae bacterium LLY-WYZ-13_1]|nr:alpha/beta hydrolase [Sandaracinaceae bacterium LLY-WYZ-13_1]